MKFSISREALLRPLTLVAGVVERRQTLPVLSNVLLMAGGDGLELTGTDLEVELVGHAQLDSLEESGSTTVPARKLMDICRSLPEGSVISFSLEDGRAVLRAGRSRFTLSTLPAAEFPNIDQSKHSAELTLPRSLLKRLIDATSFAMAQQDVRYYLNGMLFELEPNTVRVVATDGHRLALAESDGEVALSEAQRLILPRKGVLELGRLLDDTNTPITLILGPNHLRARTGGYVFTSKLIDGKFPDVNRVMPKGGDKQLVAERAELRQVLTRASILSNEKYRGVRFYLEANNLRVQANNPEQEEAEENISVDYNSPELEIGFNVGYLVDVLNVIPTQKINMTMSDSISTTLLEAVPGDEEASTPGFRARYVVMPMRL